MVLITFLLALVPAVAILYPFVRRPHGAYELKDEVSPYFELLRRWETAVAGLDNTELESAIGNLAKEDYQWLREQYMTEVALVMKAMELEEQEKDELLAGIDQEVQQVRQKALGESKVDTPPLGAG